MSTNWTATCAMLDRWNPFWDGFICTCFFLSSTFPHQFGVLSQGRCFDGRCKTRDGQCMALWGYSTFGLMSGFNIQKYFMLENRLKTGVFFQALLTDSVTKSWILKARRRGTVVLTPTVRDGFSAPSSEWNASASWARTPKIPTFLTTSLISDRDVLCGLLLCTNLTAKPSFGELQGKLTSLTIQHQNRYMDCRWARCWGE